MPKRALRVVKWIGQTPAVAVCMFCNREFKTGMRALSRVEDAKAYLQDQFDRHKCKSEDANQTAARDRSRS